MKHLKHFTIVLLAIIVSSCASDDSSNASENNFISVGESSYEMRAAIIEPTLNSVFLSLTNSTEAETTASFEGTTLNNVDYFSARINHFDLSSGETYNLSDISSLEFVVNGDVINSEFENGFSQFYKSGTNADLEVTSGSITIIDYTVDSISLSFSFTRGDGTEITGTYEGGFLYITSVDE
ncbi:hypothetical protein [Psychroserpens sp. S379A]|uniref:hypothetical protein n=1 Tax=Psychroserpens sp. S379A TaxID=3415137 RepID=UPI003C7A1F36